MSRFLLRRLLLAIPILVGVSLVVFLTIKLILTAFAALVAVVGGVGLGLVSALRRGKASATASSGVSLVAVSAPQYSVGLILIIVFSVTLGWFPAVGMYDARDQSLGSLLSHIVLPGVTAALVPMGTIDPRIRH